MTPTPGAWTADYSDVTSIAVSSQQSAVSSGEVGTHHPALLPQASKQGSTTRNASNPLTETEQQQNVTHTKNNIKKQQQQKQQNLKNNE